MTLIETYPLLGSNGTLITTYPWRPRDILQLWIDGDQYYPRMLSAIAHAERSIDMETYLISSGAVADRFINALGEAVARGVRVRLLIDAIGALAFAPVDQVRLRKTGVELRLYNPLAHKKFTMNLARDHRKILVVDHRISFVGGAGITDDFDPQVSGQEAWHDVVLESHGAVAADWGELFEQAWLYHDGLPALSARRRIAGYLRYHDFFRPLDGGGGQTRVNASNGQGHEQIKGDLVKRIRHAKRRVWIATAYFYPSRKLRQALIKAALRGCDARLLLPGPSTDHPSVRYASRRYYFRLMRNGVTIHEYQPAFLHMKVALIDEWVSLGSCNFDRWNLRWNLEANQEILDDTFATEVEGLFETDFKHSQVISPVDWERRSWKEKCREYFWYQMARLLEFVSLHRRWRR